MTLPPAFQSDLEREAERAQAEYEARYTDSNSPHARRNRMLLAVIVVGFVACLMFGGIAAGYQLSGWTGAAIFGVLWFGLGTTLLAWTIYAAPRQ